MKPTKCVINEWSTSRQIVKYMYITYLQYGQEKKYESLCRKNIHSGLDQEQVSMDGIFLWMVNLNKAQEPKKAITNFLSVHSTLNNILILPINEIPMYKSTYFFDTGSSTSWIPVRLRPCRCPSGLHGYTRPSETMIF